MSLLLTMADSDPVGAPAYSSAVMAWYDMQDLNYVTLAGSKVGRIINKKTPGTNDLLQATDGLRLDYSSNFASTGFRAAVGTATGYMDATGAASTWKHLHDGTGMMAFFAFVVNAADPNAVLSLAATHARNTAIGTWMGIDDRTSQSNNMELSIQVGNGSANAIAAYNSPSNLLAVQTVQIVAFRLTDNASPTAMRFYSNYNQHTGTNETAAFSSSNPFGTLRVLGNYGTNFPATNVGLLEAIFCNVDSDTEFDRLREYLANKYYAKVNGALLIGDSNALGYMKGNELDADYLANYTSVSRLYSASEIQYNALCASTNESGGVFSQSISAITQAANASVTTGASHGYATGSEAGFAGVGGMTQINGLLTTTTLTGATTFTCDDINSTGFSAFTSGGRVNTYTGTDAVVAKLVSDNLGNELLVYKRGSSGSRLTVEWDVTTGTQYDALRTDIGNIERRYGLMGKKINWFLAWTCLFTNDLQVEADAIATEEKHLALNAGLRSLLRSPSLKVVMVRPGTNVAIPPYPEVLESGLLYISYAWNAIDNILARDVNVAAVATDDLTAGYIDASHFGTNAGVTIGQRIASAAGF